MKIVCAPDSFKHSMPASVAADAMARGVKAVWADADVVTVPMSDGGEGFTDAIAGGLNAEVREVGVHDALGRPRAGALAVAGDLAAFEMATAAGLEHIADDEKDIMHADTRGVGELVLAALDAGATHLVIGIGGSATNDGGAGMLAALGARFLDESGAEVAPNPAGLADVVRVDTDALDPRLGDITVEVACDVDNPLLGERGASAVFGPQKGASGEQVGELDGILARLVDVTGQQDAAAQPGSGAAGGLGFALRAFLGATLLPGIDLVARTVGLADAVAGADLVLTGEGSVDAQTLSGKAPAGVAQVAREASVPVVIFGGRVAPDADALLDAGVEAIVAVTPEGTPLAEALKAGEANLEAATTGFLRKRRGGARG